MALVSDLSGVPQVWIVPVEGGWPRLVTSGGDPVGGVRWSPSGDWLAFSLLPGGGLNSRSTWCAPTAAACKRLTDGGKENNSLGDWTARRAARRR